MKDDRIYLLHVQDAIHHIVSYTAAGKEIFFSDRMTQDAVVRNLEIIGEAGWEDTHAGPVLPERAP